MNDFHPQQMTSSSSLALLWSSRLQENVFITPRHVQSELVSTPPASVKGFCLKLQSGLPSSLTYRYGCLHSQPGKSGWTWVVKLVHHNLFIANASLFSRLLSLCSYLWNRYAYKHQWEWVFLCWNFRSMDHYVLDSLGKEASLHKYRDLTF